MSKDEILDKLAKGDIQVQEAVRMMQDEYELERAELLAKIDSNSTDNFVEQKQREGSLSNNLEAAPFVRTSEGTGKGDSDPKAYIIATICGVLGGLFGTKEAVLIGAYIPVLIYQFGLEVKTDSHTQWQRGLERFFLVVFASLIPGIAGVLCGAIIGGMVHGAVIFPFKPEFE